MAVGVHASTPVRRSRGGAAAALALLLRSGCRSATPPTKVAPSPSIARACSHSPRSLLAAESKDAPSPLRRALARRRARRAAPLLLPVKKFVPMESYKVRNPEDTRTPKLVPRPFATTKTRARETGGSLKPCKKEAGVDPPFVPACVPKLPQTQEMIKYATKGGKAYANGKKERYARKKRSMEKSVLNY